MELLSSFCLILALLILIYQGLLLLKFFTTITFGKQLMQSRSWNKYYDPIITFLLTSFLVVTVLLTQSLHKNLESEDYSMLFDLFLILLTNTFFSLLFFGRKKLIQIKSKEQIEDEQAEQEKTAETEFLDHREYILKQSELEEKKTISKKLIDLERSNCDGIAGLRILSEVNIQKQEIITASLAELKKTSKDGIILLGDLANNNQTSNKAIINSLKEVNKGKFNNVPKNLSENQNYLIETDNGILEKLYIGLEKNLFIDQSKTTLKQFIEVLKLDWQNHNNIITLEMDNIQFKFFLELMNIYLNIKIPMTIIERANNIHNNNGNIKANSVYTSVSKSKMEAKEAEVIKFIFTQLN